MIRTEADLSKIQTEKMTASAWKNIGAITGAVGMVLLLSTPLTWLLTAEVGGFVLGKLVLSILGIGLYLATHAHVFRDVMGSRTTGIFAMSAGSTALALLVAIVANVLVARHPLEWDLTREGLYTLSPQTVAILQRLSSQVQIKAFYPSYDHSYHTIDETLGRYSNQAKGKLTYAMIDPQSRPDLVEKYQISEQGPRIVISQGSHDARVKEANEQELTHAIMKVAEQAPKKVYFLSGHGEGDLRESSTSPESYKHFGDAINAEGYESAQLNLQTGETQAALGTQVHLNSNNDSANQQPLTVPKDAAALIVLAPRHPVLAPEAAAIAAYLATGGRLAVFLEPHTTSGLESILQSYRISANNDLIVDTNPLGRLLGLGAAAPVIQPASTEHPIVKDLTAPAVMNTVRSLALLPGANDVEVTVLARTGESAWGETQLGADGTAARDDHDTPPPLGVALAASRNLVASNSDANQSSQAPNTAATDSPKSQSRVVVFGDSDWVSNRYLNMQGNQDLALNALGWIVEQEQKITVRPKTRASSMLYLSNADLGKLKFFSMDILPVLMVATGLGVVLIRRQR